MPIKRNSTPTWHTWILVTIAILFFWTSLSHAAHMETIWKVIDLQTSRINLQNKAIIELYERVEKLEDPPIEVELPDGYSGWRAS